MRLVVPVATLALALFAAPAGAQATVVGDLVVTIEPQEVVLRVNETASVRVTVVGTINCTDNSPPGDAQVSADTWGHERVNADGDRRWVWRLSPKEFEAGPPVYVGSTATIPPTHEYRIEHEETLELESRAQMDKDVYGETAFAGITQSTQGCSASGSWQWNVADSDVLNVTVPGLEPAGGEIVDPVDGADPTGPARFEGTTEDAGGFVLAAVAALAAALLGLAVIWGRRVE